MSPREALEVAMESEIKAYKFYDNILQVIQDANVREMIRSLRDEEAEHQALLNDQKAKYHDTTEPDFDPEIDELSFHRIRES
jgi:rubrerythrin